MALIQVSEILWPLPRRNTWMIVPDQRFSGPFYLVCLNSAMPLESLEPQTSTRWSPASRGHAWILLNYPLVMTNIAIENGHL